MAAPLTSQPNLHVALINNHKVIDLNKWKHLAMMDLSKQWVNPEQMLRGEPINLQVMEAVSKAVREISVLIIVGILPKLKLSSLYNVPIEFIDGLLMHVVNKINWIET